MAYINFSETAAGNEAVAAREGTKPVRDRFTPLEWMVIGLARKDPLSSLAVPGRLARALRSLFGLGARSRLADERLERLRRIAVLVWHNGWRLPESELAAFLREFSTDQFEMLAASIARAKAGAVRRMAV
ncbi:MAG: hypothetical protein ACM3YM_04605 [Sphingomonadales bacterium]